LSFNIFLAAATLAGSILPKVTLPNPLPVVPTSGEPDNNASFSFSNVSFLACAVCLLNTVFNGLNTLSIFLSKLLDIFCARLTSAALNPIDSLSASKNS